MLLYLFFDKSKTPVLHQTFIRLPYVPLCLSFAFSRRVNSYRLIQSNAPHLHRLMLSLMQLLYHLPCISVWFLLRQCMYLCTQNVAIARGMHQNAHSSTSCVASGARSMLLYRWHQSRG